MRLSSPDPRHERVGPLVIEADVFGGVHMGVPVQPDQRFITVDGYQFDFFVAVLFFFYFLKIFKPQVNRPERLDENTLGIAQM